MALARGRVKGQELLPCSSSHLLMVDMSVLEDIICRLSTVAAVWPHSRSPTHLHIWACVRATPSALLDNPSIYEPELLQLHLLITMFSLHDLEIVARRVISALKQMDGQSDARIAVTGDLALVRLLPAGWPAEVRTGIASILPPRSIPD